MSEAWKQWEGETVEGRYTLRQFLGGSDHSAVFVTEYGQPAQRAALKFMEARSATAQLQLSRWERAAKLSHPHLIRLVQGGRCQLGHTTMLYVVTELADENLSQIIPSRPLTGSETEYMLRSVLEVLAYLHGQGLVHSRLKPGNIMAVGPHLKVSSDAICSVGDKSIGQAVPTVYDPPEAPASGFSKAGDVWSLGITLVEALTQRPSAGEGMRQGDPTLLESVPAPFVEIARQCLRLDPQRRWTVPDIAARLLPAASAPDTNKRITRVLLPAGAGIVALALLFAGAKLLNQRPDQASTTVVPEATRAPASPKVADPKTNPPEVKPSAPALAEESTDPSKHETAKAPTAVAPATPPPPTSELDGAAVAGAVAEQVLPPVSQKSRDTITGKVRVGVKVTVDPSGNVIDATLDSPGPSRYFANLALQASRRWKFTAPQVQGQPVKSEWVLRYEFRRQSTEVHPVQTSPTSKRRPGSAS